MVNYIKPKYHLKEIIEKYMDYYTISQMDKKMF